MFYYLETPVILITSGERLGPYLQVPDLCLNGAAPQVSGRGGNFKMKARPRWFVRQSISKKVGIEILKASWGWTEFVMQFEPKPDDVWG